MLARNIHDEDTIEMQLSAEQLEALRQAYADAEDPAPMTAAAPEHPVAAAEVAAPTLIVVSAASDLPMPAVAQVVAPTVTTVPAPVALRIVPPISAAPVALPERTPAKIQIIPPAPVPAPPARQIPVGLRTAIALVTVAAVVAMLFWPRTRGPDPTTPSSPTPAVTAPLLEPLPESAPPAAATAAESPLSAGQPVPLRFANPFDSSEIFEFPAGTSYVEARDEVAQRLLARARERGGPRTPSPMRNSLPLSADHSPNERTFAKQL